MRCSMKTPQRDIASAVLVRVCTSPARGREDHAVSEEGSHEEDPVAPVHHAAHGVAGCGISMPSASQREVEHTENREHTQQSSDQDDQ